MARSCASSRLVSRRRTESSALFSCLGLVLASAASAGLYTASDQIVLLSQTNVKSVLVNSSAAMVVEFYASWCGHCVAFSPFYKKLARDIKEWKPAVNIAAIDCAEEENNKVCTNDYNIRGYPTIKFFPAYSKAGATGVAYRDHQDLQHRIIDSLEAHKEPWPPACPPLEPISQAELDVFFETNSVQHLALIFEDVNSYVGREVTLDLLQFENVTVRRVLKTDHRLVTKLGVTEFPSCYLHHPRGNFSRLRVIFEARTFYSYALQRLPGVVRSGNPAVVLFQVRTNSSVEPWRPFNRSRVYMADLESALHYSLRVELAAFDVLEGGARNALNKYVSVLAKFFPGRPVVMNLLKSLNSWLQNQTDDQISYNDFKQIMDNTAQAPRTALPEGVRWVGCQGSQPHFRSYPCGVWTLFHVLTVQANTTGGSDPLEVLNAMRNYIRHFFGCRDCAEHFENMAREDLRLVRSPPLAVIWLWSRHNRVNNRIAGTACVLDSRAQEDTPSPRVSPPTPRHLNAIQILPPLYPSVFPISPLTLPWDSYSPPDEQWRRIAPPGVSSPWLYTNNSQGALSEDPLFPKIQWPSPELCPSCHTVSESGEHKWNKEQLLSFLLSYFSSSSILTDYLEDETQILLKQKGKHARQQEAAAAQRHRERKAREALESVTLSPSPSPAEEEEEEEESPQDEAAAYEEEEGEEGAQAASEMEGKSSEPTPWVQSEMDLSRGRRPAHRFSQFTGMRFGKQQGGRGLPSIIGMQFREKRDDIVDLDSFVNQHFKDRALQLAASSRVKQRTLQTKVEQEPRPALGLGMELDAALGMMGLQPVDTELETKGKRRQKRGLAGQNYRREAELTHKGRWMSALSIGFSNLDVSLCVGLYSLSAMCLLLMYYFFKNRLKRRPVKIALA